MVNKIEHEHVWDILEINDIEENFEGADNLYQENPIFNWPSKKNL